MKSMIINFGFFMMFILASLIIVSASKKQVIREEATEALSVSIRNTMELWLQHQDLSEQELINNFLTVFEKNISSKCEYNIYFYDIDTTNGLMDVGIEAIFKYPNLKIGSINIRKTMLYDEKISKN